MHDVAPLSDISLPLARVAPSQVEHVHSPEGPEFDASNAAIGTLAGELRGAIGGEVRFDRLSRTLYATDASIYEIVPSGVVIPRTVEDVVTTVRLCGQHRVPIVPRGAGTGIAGGAIGKGVAIDFSKYLNRIEPIDPGARTVRVEPGVVLDDLNAAAAQHGLQFPADVATSSRATLGGMIANNSCGAHSIIYGRTIDHLIDVTCVLSDGSVVTWVNHPVAKGRSTAGSAAAAGLAGRIESELGHVREAYRAEVEARYPKVMRRNGGYALDRLCADDAINAATVVCGSEGTLALVIGATLSLVPLPKFKALLVVHFHTVLDALGATPQVLRHNPSAVELVDNLILSAGYTEMPASTRDAFLVGEPTAILVVEFYDDNVEQLQQRLDALNRELAADSIGYARVPVIDSGVQRDVWNLRNRGFGLLTSKPGDRQPHEFIEDAAVDPSRLRDYIGELDAMLESEGVTGVAHYAHASVGVIHVRPVLNLKDPADVVRLKRVADRASDLVLKFGGAFTGEHGDGIVRSCWLEKMYGPRIVQAFRDVKQAFDPDGLFNPGKIVDPLPMDENLRYGGDYRTRSLKTYFDYTAYGGMAGMAGMCSGVGQCRQKLVGTMCPSYMATLEEQHTTRARANALRSALSNRGLLEGLDDPALADVMDLCLSCKACKTECPTGVDMARLKAEWLAHRNQRHGVSRSARFIADSPQMAAMGARFPWLANFVLQSPWLRELIEQRYGLDRRIDPPAFATQTFRKWFRAHKRRRVADARTRHRKGTNPAGHGQAIRPLAHATRAIGAGHATRAEDGSAESARSPRGRVVYFVDTWTNYYWPQVGIAAVRLLEAAGFHVVCPPLECCGRPLISKGLLAEAAELARANVESLNDFVDQGCYIVGSEPSCILTLIDEYPHFVRSDDARKLALRVMTVESLLARVLRTDSNAINFAAPSNGASIRYHGHCHQKALIGTADANFLLNAPPGFSATEINSGCCGMAGSFGHEAAHYDVARAVGEQRLFPAIRARGDAQIAVSGFSCREQIHHHLGLMPRHVLELVAEALAGGD